MWMLSKILGHILKYNRRDPWNIKLCKMEEPLQGDAGQCACWVMILGLSLKMLGRIHEIWNNAAEMEGLCECWVTFLGLSFNILRGVYEINNTEPRM